jgi:sec-independent protein translocase protein TatA
MPFAGNIGIGEIAIVLVIALIVLGPKRLPDAGRALGRGMKEFRDSISGVAARRDEDDELDTPLTRTK